MTKKRSLFASYCILLFCSVIGGVAILSWFQTSYLMNHSNEYLPGLKITMIITVSLTIMIAVACFIVTRPFQKIYANFSETGNALSEAEQQTIIGTYRKMNIVSVVGTIIGFALGNGTTVLVKFLLGKYNGTILQVSLAMTQAIIYACFVSIILVYVTDFIFSKFRQELHLYDITKFKMGWSIAKTIRITVIISFLFIIINTLMVAFSSFAQLVPEYGKDYIYKNITSAILNLIPSCAITLLMLNTLNSRIATSEKHIKNLADGSATDLIDITNIDDFGSLTSSTNDLIKKQRTLVAKINQETNNINAISENLTKVSDEAANALQSVTNSYKQIAEESDKQKTEIVDSERDVHGLTKSVRDVEGEVVEQSEVMQESSAAITEMTENINSLVDMTVKADDVSQNLSTICSESFDSLKNANEAMKAIQLATDQIVEIIKEIQKISSQTNLLAMNAAIEAAHAGQFGTGFAVVADEVRSLAKSSADSAKSIRNEIKNMVSRVAVGAQAIALIEDSFGKIENSVKQNAEITANITHALREQQVGAENNMQATNRIADNAKKVKNLVIEQNKFTCNVESSIKNVVESTDAMSMAINTGVQAADTMQEVVNRISETIKSNKTVVGELKKLMETYSTFKV